MKNVKGSKEYNNVKLLKVQKEKRKEKKKKKGGKRREKGEKRGTRDALPEHSKSSKFISADWSVTSPFQSSSSL